MTRRHALRFRGEDYAVPTGYARCTTCGALVTMEDWAGRACPGRPGDLYEAEEIAEARREAREEQP